MVPFSTNKNYKYIYSECAVNRYYACMSVHRTAGSTTKKYKLSTTEKMKRIVFYIFFGWMVLSLLSSLKHLRWEKNMKQFHLDHKIEKRYFWRNNNSLFIDNIIRYSDKIYNVAIKDVLYNYSQILSNIAWECHLCHTKKVLRLQRRYNSCYIGLIYHLSFTSCQKLLSEKKG